MKSYTGNIMLKLLASACAGLALTAGTAMAQGSSSKTYESSGSGIEFYATNFGIFGQSPSSGEPGLVYPKGSAKGYMFGSGLWFGAQKNVAGELKKLTFVTYNPKSGYSWATPGELVSDPEAALPTLFSSIEHSTADGGYTGQAQDHPDWPLWLLQGMRATPMNPGIFEAVDSQRVRGKGYTRPAFVEGTSEQLVSRFHDGDLQRYEVVSPEEQAGFPLGLQIQQSIYAWGQGLYAPVVLLQYQIVNRSVDTLLNCVAGQVSDPDIGMQENDFMRYYTLYPEFRSAYAWTEDEGTGHGALVMSLIEAPVTDSAGFVDNTARGSYKVNGRIGSFPDWTMEDPKGSAERYDFMTRGTFANNLQQGDQRALMASTTFSMRPGDTAYFAVAYIVLDSVPEYGKTSKKRDPRTPARITGPTDTYEAILVNLLEDYYERGAFNLFASTAPDGYEPETDLSLTALPNLVDDRATIRLTLAKPADGTLRITDNLGQTLLVRNLGHRPAGTYDEAIDASALPTGLYFAIVESSGRTCITRFMVAR